MKQSLLLFSGLAFAASAVSGQIAIYNQPFDNATGSDQNIENAPWNWGWAIQGGGGRPGGSNVGRVSGSAGVGGDPGFGVNIQNISALREMITWYAGSEVANIAQSSLTGFSIDLRHGSAASETRFVIRIGDDWFATTQAFTVDVGNADNWVNRSWTFTTAGAAWTPILDRTDTSQPFGGVTGGNGFTALGTGTLAGMTDPLPSGAITAVGVFNRSAGNNWPDPAIRYDNFTVIPEPSTYALLFGLGAMALLLYRRRIRA